LASKHAVDAKAEPTAVPFTIASPSFGCNSNGSCIPASLRAISPDTSEPSLVIALEFGLAVRSPAIE